MSVYPDGEALSDWERDIIEEFERELGVGPSPWAVSGLRGDRAAVYAFAPYLLAAEAAVVVAALTVSMAGALARLATIGPSIWMTSVGTTQGLRAMPGRVHRVRH
jgi:hypothetical protein